MGIRGYEILNKDIMRPQKTIAEVRVPSFFPDFPMGKFAKCFRLHQIYYSCSWGKGVSYMSGWKNA